MASQMDTRQNLKTGTADKAKTPIIRWSKMDEELRLVHDEKVENSQEPSIWEYNPKGGVPKELANLDPSTFLTSRQGQILCFLPMDVLVRICSMLSVRDFFHLSLTCRALHWRMFTFCTCYVPYIVRLTIDDKLVSKKKAEYDIPPKLIYTLNNGFIGNEDEHAGFGHDINGGGGEREQDSQRGLFVYQPFGLRKPFFFETLDIYISLPSYCKQYYDRCLPYIVAVRDLARELTLLFCPKTLVYDYPDTNDFLTTINASECTSLTNPVDIYVNCPYTHLMSRVDVFSDNSRNRLNVPIFQNSIGIYWFPLDSAFKATLKNFVAGSTNLVFHRYICIEENKEFGSTIINYSFHSWKKMITTENGIQLRIAIEKGQYSSCVTIGKEETFDEMDPLYFSFLRRLPLVEDENGRGTG